MQIVFMGTPEFAVPCLEKLIESKHQVVGVFTQPDKKRGRGQKVTFSPVKICALENNIPVFQPKSLKNETIYDTLLSIDPQMIVVVAYGKILPEYVLNYPKFGCINIHASLLPRWRGAGPIQWSLISGDEKTGITSMFMEKGLDTGDMILKSEVIIDNDDNFETLHDKLKVVGSKVLIDTIELIEKNSYKAKKQDDEKAVYAPMIEKEMGNLDFHKDAYEIKNLVRGLSPWPGAFFIFEDKLFKVYKVKSHIDEKYKNIPEGEIIACDIENGLLIKCLNSSYISIEEIQRQGKKKMSITDFLKGYSFPVGTIIKRENH